MYVDVDLSRQILYTQMMLPLKVSMLSEKISTTYLEVSNKYILPAQRCVKLILRPMSYSSSRRVNRAVGGMMQFSEDTSPEGRAKLQGSLCHINDVVVS